MSNALIGHGTEFWFSTDSDAANLEEIAEVKTVGPPNSVADDVEVTHLKSPNKRKEYILGLIEDGEGEFMMNLIPGSASDTLLRGARDAGDARAYRIVLPASGGGTWQIDGTALAKGYARDIQGPAAMEATLMVRFTGASTEAAGS